jgi:hypothetical protein
MKPTIICLFAGCVLAGSLAARNRGVIDTSESPHAKLRSFDLEAVTWSRGFWADRFNLVRDAGLPRMWEVMQDARNSANVVNLRIAAGLAQGKYNGNDWSDGDVYKAIETMATVWQRTRDPKLERLMDDAIALVAKVQTPEGYIGSHTQLGVKKRWGSLQFHELYNMGHLITAACVHHRITGKDNFLNVAKKTADYLYTVFQPRPRELAHFCFNPSQIMAVVELYRVTREPKYLELGGIFVDMRGSQPGGTDVNQTHVPLREETEAVGHSVVGPYLWAGAADVYAETGEKALLAALERIWNDAVYRKMYVTGGIAALHFGVSFRRDRVHEAFGLEYELPNRTAYNETCASLAHAMWGWRMLGVTANARYADVVEQVLYNAALAGWGADGKSYCYTNPLRRFGKEDRLLSQDSLERWQATFDPGAPHCYCCPPNMTRTVAQFAGWAYSWSKQSLWVNFYGANTLKTALPDGTRLDLKQETDYPWDGKIRITLNQAVGGDFALMLRIPVWAPNATLAVNGKPAGVALRPQSYAEIRRRWAAGDKVELDLGMKAQLIEGHPKLEEARNQVAVTRGPVVYCLESPDLPPDVRIEEVAMPAGARLTPRYDAKLLNGVTVLEGEGRRIRAGNWSGLLLYRPLGSSPAEPIKLRLIPYFAWGNRGIPYMTVWLPLAN